MFWSWKEFMYLFWCKITLKFGSFIDFFIFYWKIAVCSISLPCFNNMENWIVNHLDSMWVFYGWLDFSSWMVFSYPWQLYGAYPFMLGYLGYFCASLDFYILSWKYSRNSQLKLLLHCKSLWYKTYVSHSVSWGSNVSMVMMELNHHYNGATEKFELLSNWLCGL